MFPVTLNGYAFEDSMLTFHLASGITAADVGKAVALDTTAPNKVKLAGDDDYIIGRLETVELRTQEGQNVGTVALRFAQRLPIKSGETIAVGDSLIGAGAGEVKAQAAYAAIGDVPLKPSRTIAVEIIGSSVVALHI